MVKGLRRTIDRGNNLNFSSGFRRLRFPIVNQTLTIAAAGAGVGFGNLSFGLPEGYLLIHAVTAFFQLSTASANITNATFGGNSGIGTTASVAGALTGNEVNLCPSTALPAAVAKAVTGARIISGSIPILAAPQDNHSKTMTMNLNVNVNAADIADATSAPFLVNGYIDAILAIMGDN